MNGKNKISAVDRARLASQEEWIIEFFKNKFQVPYSRVKEAISRVGISYAALENYLES
jgi:hypothetical protein